MAEASNLWLWPVWLVVVGPWCNVGYLNGGFLVTIYFELVLGWVHCIVLVGV